jgi:hypothetical protein
VGKQKFNLQGVAQSTEPILYQKLPVSNLRRPKILKLVKPLAVAAVQVQSRMGGAAAQLLCYQFPVLQRRVSACCVDPT